MAGGLTYDTGALIAAERNDRRIWALHRRSLERGIVPTVPAGVLAQGWRGGPQTPMSRVLSGCRIEPFDEPRARSAGAACGTAGTSDVVDAAVVVGASARDDIIVSSDPRDLKRLSDALRITIRLEII
jgi:hypothetical protein